jgi:UDPglucose 6-dehydrogenase
VRIAVIGTGYVGLVTGTCLAEVGNSVVCVDVDDKKVAMMKKGQIPIYEPGLEAVFHRTIAEQKLSFTTDLAEGIKEAEVVFLALPTPPGEDGSADLSYVLGVAADLGPLLDHYTVIINKSTVPIGTTKRVYDVIAKAAKVPYDVVSNPEFLREGFAVSDFMKPDRIIVGTQSDKARKILELLYKPYVRQGNPIYFMDEASAEMTKYAANSFLATKISFMNEIANLCELMGANVDAVRLGIGADERIGKRFLFPGPGYGGSCFPKDVQAIQYMAQQHDYTIKILEAVSKVNTEQKQRIVNKLRAYFDGRLKDKTIALWGLAFKADTDDTRESPALAILDALLSEGARVVAYDPEAVENVRKSYGDTPNLTLAGDAYQALDGADCLLIATEWAEFRTPDFAKIKKLLKNPVIFDARNLFETKEIGEQGFHYESIGRTPVN